eukprot:9472700-Pyramimonas_sp.AAC.7
MLLLRVPFTRVLIYPRALRAQAPPRPFWLRTRGRSDRRPANWAALGPSGGSDSPTPAVLLARPSLALH